MIVTLLLACQTDHRVLYVPEATDLLPASPSADEVEPRLPTKVPGAVVGPYAAPVPAADTGGVEEVDPVDTGLQEEPVVVADPIEARIEADVDEGEFPLVVTFDGSGSEVGTHVVRYEWTFGDGATSTEVGSAEHTYVGKGDFEVTLAIVDDTTGEVSVAEVTIDVDTPDCPSEDNVVDVGHVEDDGLSGVSGMVASRVHPDVVWIQEDAGRDTVIAIDPSGVTLSEHEIQEEIDDVEDLATAIDPETGVAMLFLADVGDHGEDRDEVVVWIVEEPDPYSDSELEPLGVRLTYPGGSVDVESLLVDPLTLDLYLITKTGGDEQTVFRKQAPHDDEGPYELEDLGTWSGLDDTTTSGDISPDGQRVVVRGYGGKAKLWYRDGYRSLEEVFDEDACEIDLAGDGGGEAITFSLDGEGLYTMSEGVQVPVYYIGL